MIDLRRCAHRMERLIELKAPEKVVTQECLLMVRAIAIREGRDTVQKWLDEFDDRPRPTRMC